MLGCSSIRKRNYRMMIISKERHTVLLLFIAGVIVGSYSAGGYFPLVKEYLNLQLDSGKM
jgi:hypothetical protein